jgi:hypothetical protein
MTDIAVFREGNRVVIAITSKYGRPQILNFTPDDARDLATSLFQEADDIDASYDEARPTRARILKLIQKPENPG